MLFLLKDTLSIKEEKLFKAWKHKNAYISKTVQDSDFYKIFDPQSISEE